MFKLTIFGALALGAAGAACAQTDTAPSAATGWNGPYAGLHAGYGFDDGRQMDVGGTSAITNGAIASGARPINLDQNRAGFVGGGQVGWNFQYGNWVFGPEGDFSYMHSRGTSSLNTLTGLGGVQNTIVRTRMEWMGSARLRAGYAIFGNGLIYGTGGYAVGKVKGSAAFNGPTGTQDYAGRNSYTAQGWTAGGGGEFRPFVNGQLSKVSLGAEVTYYDLGRSHIVAGPTSTAALGTGAFIVGRNTRGYNGVVKVNYAF